MRNCGVTPYAGTQVEKQFVGKRLQSCPTRDEVASKASRSSSPNTPCDQVNGTISGASEVVLWRL